MKKDKGFELIYWKLSYRRKFIRTLWWTPLLVVVLALIWESNSNVIYKTIATVFSIFIHSIQLIYNYIKWTNTEKSS